MNLPCVDTPTRVITCEDTPTHVVMQLFVVMQYTKCTMSTQYIKYVRTYVCMYTSYTHYIHASTYVCTYVNTYTYPFADNYHNLVYFVLLCTHCISIVKTVVRILYAHYQLYTLYDECTRCSLYMCARTVRTYLLYRSNWSGCCRSCERGRVQ